MGIRCITLRVTERCNYNCNFCYHPKKGKYEMTVSDIDKIFSLVKNSGCNTLMISGGEPLLRDDLFEIVKIACTYGIKTKLSTNGILLNKLVLNKLKKRA